MPFLASFLNIRLGNLTVRTAGNTYLAERGGLLIQNCWFFEWSVDRSKLRSWVRCYEFFCFLISCVPLFMQLAIYLERVDVIYRRIDDDFLDPLNGRCCQCPKPNSGRRYREMDGLIGPIYGPVKERKLEMTMEPLGRLAMLDEFDRFGGFAVPPLRFAVPERRLL